MHGRASSWWYILVGLWVGLLLGLITGGAAWVLILAGLFTVYLAGRHSGNAL